MFVTWLGACDRQAPIAPCLSPINSSLLNRPRPYTGELLSHPSKWEMKYMKRAGYAASVPEEGWQEAQASIRSESSLSARTGTRITKNWDMSLGTRQNWRRCIFGFHGCGIVSIEQVSALVWRLHTFYRPIYKWHTNFHFFGKSSAHPRIASMGSSHTVSLEFPLVGTGTTTGIQIVSRSTSPATLSNSSWEVLKIGLRCQHQWNRQLPMHGGDPLHMKCTRGAGWWRPG